MVFESVRLLAVISVVFCLIPAGAHFFELANKMSLSTAEYMTTQKIYAGWAFFGVAIIAAIIFTLTHTLMVRAERAAFFLSLTALLCLGATQVIFWTFTYPADRLSGLPGPIASPKSLRNRHHRGGLLSNDGEKHHDLCRWICCGRSYYQS